ncbi:MAG: sigma-70 family RNA polymerase sigma factor [Actinobacteria bacterium]|nr:sigma-70 family RNA polymerase sigma factor [Actinomycetota bacterium]
MRVDPGFEELYRANHSVVFRAAYLLSGRREIAEDATQEAFARALERWSRLGGQPWVAGWVMSTALNEVRRSWRRRGAASPTDVGEGLPGGEDAIDLWRGIRRLPRRQQEAVVLHYVADRPLGEVAAVMGCQVGTVKAHLSRARKVLARAMEVTRDEI